MGVSAWRPEIRVSAVQFRPWPPSPPMAPEWYPSTSGGVSGPNRGYPPNGTWRAQARSTLQRAEVLRSRLSLSSFVVVLPLPELQLRLRDVGVHQPADTPEEGPHADPEACEENRNPNRAAPHLKQPASRSHTPPSLFRHTASLEAYGRRGQAVPTPADARRGLADSCPDGPELLEYGLRGVGVATNPPPQADSASGRPGGFLIRDPRMRVTRGASPERGRRRGDSLRGKGAQAAFRLFRRFLAGLLRTLSACTMALP